MEKLSIPAPPLTNFHAITDFVSVKVGDVMEMEIVWMMRMNWAAEETALLEMEEALEEGVLQVVVGALRVMKEVQLARLAAAGVALSVMEEVAFMAMAQGVVL